MKMAYIPGDDRADLFRLSRTDVLIWLKAEVFVCHVVCAQSKKIITLRGI